VRFLWIWITLLPFALSRTFVDFGTGTWWADEPCAMHYAMHYVMHHVMHCVMHCEMH